MKGSSSLSFLVLVASACSASGGPPASGRSPVIWPAGRYDLDASVRYNEATPLEQWTATEEYFAQLTVAPDGTLTLTSSAGLCRDPNPARSRTEEPVGGRAFECGDVTYSLGPEGGTIGGRISARVRESYRVPGPCRQRATGVGGQDICIRPSWRVEYRTSIKTARLRGF